MLVGEHDLCLALIERDLKNPDYHLFWEKNKRQTFVTLGNLGRFRLYRHIFLQVHIYSMPGVPMSGGSHRAGLILVKKKKEGKKYTVMLQHFLDLQSNLAEISNFSKFS